MMAGSRPMNIIEAAQGSAAWFAARAGKVTASKVADALSFLKRGDKRGDESAGRAAYKAQVVAETLTGVPELGGYLSPSMQHGTATEPSARAAYESRYDVLVETVGFVIHPHIDRAGASPDGLVGDDGLLEIKCCKTETHLRYLMADRLPPEYEPQVMWQMACTGRQWCDFVSFDPRLPARHQLFKMRVPRDEQRIAEMEAGVLQFLAEVDALIVNLETLNPALAPPEMSDAGPQWDDAARLDLAAIDAFFDAMPVQMEAA